MGHPADHELEVPADAELEGHRDDRALGQRPGFDRQQHEVAGAAGGQARQRAAEPGQRPVRERQEQRGQGHQRPERRRVHDQQGAGDAQPGRPVDARQQVSGVGLPDVKIDELRQVRSRAHGRDDAEGHRGDRAPEHRRARERVARQVDRPEGDDEGGVEGGVHPPQRLGDRAQIGLREHEPEQAHPHHPGRHAAPPRRGRRGRLARRGAAGGRPGAQGAGTLRTYMLEPRKVSGA